MAGLFSRRLLWILGCFPLLSADIAIAVSLAQLSVPEQRLLTQASEALCQPEALTTYLENAEWQAVVQLLQTCDFSELRKTEQLQASLRAAIRQGSENQQIVGLYGWQELGLRAAAAGEPQITGSLINELVTELQGADSPLTETVQAIAASTLTTLAISLIETLDPTAEDGRFLALVNGETTARFDLSALIEEALLPLATTDAPNTERLRLTATEALRDLGYALQAHMDRLRLASGSNEVWQGDRSWAKQVITEMTARLSREVAPDRLPIDSDRSAAQQRLITAAQVAKVEALGSFLFLSSADMETFSEAAPVERLCFPKAGAITDWGIQFLNCLSAQQEATAADGEMVEIDTSVRAAAIAELERLGTLPTFRRPLADRLRDLAVPSASPSAELGWNDWTNTSTDIRIGAVESMSRAERLRAPQRPTPRSLEDQQTQSTQARRWTDENRYGPSISQTMDMLVLLADGLDNSDLDEQTAADVGINPQELQQRAEIAFNEIYDQDIGRIGRAVRYAGAAGNTVIQRNAVKALGAVSYGRLAEAVPDTDLVPLAQFLGQSLLCSPRAEVRRDAAFALGQLAPHYPDLLQEPLGTDWQRLLPNPAEASLNSAFVAPCQQIAQTDVAAATPKVIDALVLRMGDREQPVVVTSAYALSRYGIALASTINEADFIGRDSNETAIELSRLKACMQALVSPTRFADWPSEVHDDPMYAALAGATEQHTATCEAAEATAAPYLLPLENRNESAIAAAFVLGQVGISDGEAEANDHERETVAYLLRSLRGHDLLYQREVGATTPERITSVATLQAAYPDAADREDSVRDSIVGYALSQIHPREHGLVEQLTAAVLFEQPPERFAFDRQLLCSDTSEANIADGFNCVEEIGYDLTRSLRSVAQWAQPSAYAERTLSCDGLIAQDQYFACIDDPITRAAVIGAVEVIGLEALQELDAAPSRHQDQRAYVQTYLKDVRQLLTQDVSPVLTEAVVTTVVERIMILSGSANSAATTTLSATTSGSQSVSTSSNLDDADLYAPIPNLRSDNSLLRAEDTTVAATDRRDTEATDSLLSIHGNLAATRYTLAMPFTSLYSCAGAAYGLARLGVYNEATVNQLVNYLFVYPEPLIAPSSQSLPADGNFCMPGEPTFGGDLPDGELPDQLEQLVIFKTGAIAALGGMELHDPQTVRIYPRDQIQRGEYEVDQDPAEANNIPTGTIDQIVECLIKVANLDPLPAEACEPPITVEWTATEITEAEQTLRLSSQNIASYQTQGLSFKDVALAIANRDAWREFNWNIGQIAQAAKYGLMPEDLILAELAEWQGFNLPFRETMQAIAYGLTPADIEEGFTEGLYARETVRAAKWGLTPEEFFVLKLRLQEPAIAAIGQLAITTESPAAIEALAIVSRDEQGNESSPPITGRSSGIRGLSVEALNTLKLENLEAVLQARQSSTSADYQIRTQKIEPIIEHYLIPELTIDVDAYTVKASINDYFTREPNNPDDFSDIDEAAIAALADGLRQEVDRLVRAYQREMADSNLTSRERAKLHRDYTERLQGRAAKLREYEEAFRDEVLKVLVGLDRSTISSLDVGIRANLIEQLGVGDRPELMAQQCLTESDIFRQERLCHGLAKLVSAALGPQGGAIDRADVANSVEFLQTLVGEDDSQYELERSSPIIRASGIEYLSAHLGDLSDLAVGVIAPGDFHTLLLERLADEDEEPGVIENAIAAYWLTAPVTGVAELIDQLEHGDPSEQMAATQMLARLGQDVHRDGTWATGVPIASADSSDLGALPLESASQRWQIALNNDRLVAALTSIATNPQNESELRSNAISAIGYTRANDAAAVDLLRRTLIDPGQPLEMRLAAAYSLGNIGQATGAIADDLSADMLKIVLNDDEPSELRVVTAFGVSKFDDFQALSLEQRMAVTQSLVHLYEDAQAQPPQADELLISPNAQKAIILYALGQFEIATQAELESALAVRLLSDRVAQIYAEALAPANAIAVRVTAATYARNLTRWNGALADALITAFADPNLAVRYAAVESVRLQQVATFERLNEISQQPENLADANAQTYEEKLVAALVNVFWNEQEYGFIRLAAGQALNGVLDENEQIILDALNITPDDQQFVDLLTALENLDEFSAGFRAPTIAAGGGDAILQVLRSADLLAEFDTLLSQQLLFEILEAIRENIPGGQSGVSNVNRQQPKTVTDRIVETGRRVWDAARRQWIRVTN